jgi:hypothetical protein
MDESISCRGVPPGKTAVSSLRWKNTLLMYVREEVREKCTISLAS